MMTSLQLLFLIVKWKRLRISERLDCTGSEILFNYRYLDVYNATINVPPENVTGNCFFHGVRNQDY